MTAKRRLMLRCEPLEPRRLLATLALNTGGGSIGDYDADDLFTGGRQFSTSDAINVSGVVDPAPAAVYQSERTGQGGSDFRYDFTGLLPGESYDLRLHFAEIYWNEAGQRSFDVLINNTQVLNDYDVFVEAGGADRAVVEEFTAIADASGEIGIEFLTEADNAKVSAIEITGELPEGPEEPETFYDWTAVADAPLPVFEGQGAAVGDRLYLQGGYFNGPLDVTVQTYAYTPATDSWERLADGPLELTHGAQAVDGDKLYLLGGFVGTNPGPSTDEVWIYDTTLDTWTQGPSLPGDRGGGGAAIVGRQLHYFGGATRAPGEGTLVDQPDHWVLDLGASDSTADDAAAWTVAADLPNPRNHMAGAAIGGIVYALGGQHGNNEDSGNQDDLHAFDPATGQWTQLADLPIPLGHISASVTVVDGNLVVVAGVTQGRTKSDRVFSYNPVLNEWTELPSLPAARQSPVVGLIGDELVVATGFNGGIFGDTWKATTPSGPRLLFVRGADRSGGFLEAGNDSQRTEQLADLYNTSTSGGNHGWAELRETLETAGFQVDQITETAENTSGPSDGVHIDFEQLNIAEYDAIVFGSNNAVYDTAAVDAIEDYLRGGGSALFISDANFGGDWADASDSDQQFLDRFGLIMHQDQGTYSLFRSQGDFAIPDHPILTGVDRFDGEGVTPIELGTPTTGVDVDLIVGAKNSTRLNEPPFGGNNQGPSRSSNPAIDGVLVAGAVDAGKIAGHFDRNTFFNLNGAGTDINRFDNKQYALNLFGWLVGAFDPLPGDYDGNGAVEPADHAVWAAAYGTVGASPADGNGDGRVDAADYTIWRDNLGATAPAVDLSLPASATVESVLALAPVVAPFEPTEDASPTNREPLASQAIDNALLLLLADEVVTEPVSEEDAFVDDEQEASQGPTRRMHQPQVRQEVAIAAQLRPDYSL